MKILITTCGVGIGHASRDLALAELLEKKGHEIEFASYNSGLHYLQKNKQKVHQIPSMNFQGEKGQIDIKQSLKKSKTIPYTFIKTIHKEIKLIKKIKPDLIITDSDYSAPISAKIQKTPCYIITNELKFTFSQSTSSRFVKNFEKFVEKLIQKISKKADLILIPDIPNTVKIPEKLENKTYFIGPLLHNNTKNIKTKKELRQKYNIRDDKKVVVVTIGGSEFGKILIENICKIADKLEVDTIIMFTGLEIDPTIFKKEDSKKEIIIKQFTYNLTEWMKLSDLTIALAGHTTTMELISIKKPNILIPLTNHSEQQKNIERIKPYNITKTTQINNKEELIKIINTTIKNIDNIKINQEYDKFIKYDGRQNALELINKIKKYE